MAGVKAFNFKVVLLGEGAVGKTSLVIRYIEDKFNDKHVSTLQAHFSTKKVNIDNTRVNLAIWDTAGQERFHALGPIYYRDSNGAVLVYDITDEDSFQRVKNWVKELRKTLKDEVSLAIVGNKMDLEKSRVVPLQDAEDYSKSVGAKHYQTSAKTNKGIDDMFRDLSKRMVEQAKNKPAATPTSSRTVLAGRSDILVSDTIPEAQPKTGCCS
ncbi:DgyrCDS13306 [Dimorphilus gyrociliatus]|uniref:Ras-related protein Rab-21 n=1 Tax=Dimorphilus gyrociliatus TaxID=2664684 RepID=A0A7I8WAA6_9ANNE|nr:DgyrCDS13306 [Dimorphilus gyrociliatus]